MCTLPEVVILEEHVVRLQHEQIRVCLPLHLLRTGRKRVRVFGVGSSCTSAQGMLHGSCMSARQTHSEVGVVELEPLRRPGAATRLPWTILRVLGHICAEARPCLLGAAQGVRP